MYGESLKSDGQKGTLYIGVQFENDEWQSIESKDLAAELFHYAGKFITGLRHLELTNTVIFNYILFN